MAAYDNARTGAFRVLEKMRDEGVIKGLPYSSGVLVGGKHFAEVVILPSPAHIG
jgi:hypothetical protein